MRSFSRRLRWAVLTLGATALLLVVMLWIVSARPGVENRTLRLESPPRLYEMSLSPGYVHLVVIKGWPGLSMLGWSHSFDFGHGVAVTHGFFGLTEFSAPVRIYERYSLIAHDIGVGGGGLSGASANPLWGFQLSIPLWQPAALLAAPWIMRIGAFAVRRLRRRFPLGHCRRCGYDLRGTPDRCPECGTPAAKAAL